jgi:DNA-binding response OmpR family regulator
VIFITGMSGSDNELLGLQLGAVDYIAKPFINSHVRLRVQNQMELKRRNELLREQRAILEKRTWELENALLRIKHLEGLIPICMYCKKIRNDQQSWQVLEEYLAEHTDASFTHGMCPDCLDSHMNGLHAMFEGKSSAVCKRG